MKNYINVVLLFILAGATLCYAKPYLHEEAGLELNYPDEWTIEVPADYEDYEDSEEFDENVYLTPPKEDLLVIGSMVWEISFNEAEQMVKDIVLENNESVKILSKKEDTVNGMKALFGEGKVVVESNFENSLIFAAVETPDGNMMIFHAVAEKDVLDKYKDEFQKIVKGTVAKEIPEEEEDEE
jgi:hypothetical protein